MTTYRWIIDKALNRATFIDRIESDPEAIKGLMEHPEEITELREDDRLRARIMHPDPEEMAHH